MASTILAPGCSPVTGEWNDSLKGDYCRPSINFRQAAPDVMTSMTWSLLWLCLHRINPIRAPGGHP